MTPSFRAALVAAALVVTAGAATPATADDTTFGDLMKPASTTPWTSSWLTYTVSTKAPAWGTLKRARWDKSGAFTHSLSPKPMGTLASALNDKNWQDPARAEYPGTDASRKSTDVTFTVTAKRFAVVFPASNQTDAMIWINSRPLASSPIVGRGYNARANNWVAISFPTRRTVNVRVAGPPEFTGVDTPAKDGAVVRAATPRLTLGVLSDSYYDVCSQARCMSRSAAPTLATLTGFRVWNLAEAGTGYTAAPDSGSAGYKSSPFGSTKRLSAIRNAPLDALLIGGSMNDGPHAGSEHEAAVNSLLSELEASDPGLPVILLGTEPIPGALQADAWWARQSATLTSTLAGMAEHHPNVVGFIDPFTDPWITGSGSFTNPKGDGNADQYIGKDSIHPSIAGVSYYQSRVVAELRKLSASPTSTARR